jgi:hypothetical protein
MTTEAELQKAVADAEAYRQAAKSDLEVAQKAIRPAISDHQRAENAVRTAQAALDKFRRENVAIQDFEVVEVDAPPFYAVEYTGPEMIPSLNLWLKKHTGDSASAYSTEGLGVYAGMAWIDRGDDRDLLKVGGFVVVRSQDYPVVVEVYNTKQAFGMYFEEKKEK